MMLWLVAHQPQQRERGPAPDQHGVPARQVRAPASRAHPCMVTCHTGHTCHACHESTLVLAAGEGTLAVGEEPEDEVEGAEAEADEGGGAVHRGHQEAHQQHSCAFLAIVSHFRPFFHVERGGGS